MRLSHRRVKWNEIRYTILRRPGGFGTNNSHMNFAKCELKLWFKNVFSCVRRFSTDVCQYYTSEKNHTSSSQTLYKFVPSETEKVRIGNNQEMAQSERNSHSINRGVGKTKMTLRYLYHENML